MPGVGTHAFKLSTFEGEAGSPEAPWLYSEFKANLCSKRNGAGATAVVLPGVLGSDPSPQMDPSTHMMTQKQTSSSTGSDSLF